MKLIAIHAATTNDTNGNPRRVFVLLDPDGDVKAVIDEGHMGTGALDEFRDTYEIVNGPRFEVTPAAYRDLRKYKTYKPS